MQLSTVSPTGPSRSPDKQRQVVLPDILAIFGGSLDPQTGHGRRVAANERRQERHDAAQEHAAHGAATHEQRRDDLQQAERKMGPGSRARQRHLEQRPQQRATAEQTGFRRALNDATARKSSEPAVQPTTTPATKEAQTQTKGQAGATGDKPAAQASSPLNTRHGAPQTTATSGSTAPLTPAGDPRQAQTLSPASRATPAGRAAPAITATSAGARPSTGQFGNPTDTRSTSGTAKAKASGLDKAPAQTRNSDTNVARMMRLIHTRMGKNRSVATMRLDPPELGTIRVHMDLRNDQLFLRVDTETSAARRLLAEQLDTLRHNLEASGIQLERVELRSPASSTQTPDSGTPYDTGTEADNRDGSADAGAAGSGEYEEPESSTPDAATIDREPTQEPATESLVNVLA